VLRAAAEAGRWEVLRGRIATGEGIGIACGFEKGGRVATCAHVRVSSHRLEIVRIVTAYDCGALVNPDNVRRQIEGATVMGLGGALFEAVHFDAGRILNASMRSYRVPRMTDVPELEVVLLDRPEIPPAGAGETPIVAIAPAVGNAIFAASCASALCRFGMPAGSLQPRSACDERGRLRLDAAALDVCTRGFIGDQSWR
jgi:nicotinate dehydrogenase subunit B